MPFPPIHYGIVCEEIRQEQRNLISILGFYGVMPEVEIAVQHFEGPLRLAFLLVGGQGGGAYQFTARILRPDGQALGNPPAIPININPANPRTHFGVGMIGVTLPLPGTYTFELLVGGERVYSSTFAVRQAHPGEIPA